MRGVLECFGGDALVALAVAKKEPFEVPTAESIVKQVCAKVANLKPVNFVDAVTRIVHCAPTSAVKGLKSYLSSRRLPVPADTPSIIQEVEKVKVVAAAKTGKDAPAAFEAVLREMPPDVLFAALRCLPPVMSPDECVDAVTVTELLLRSFQPRDKSLAEILRLLARALNKEQLKAWLGANCARTGLPRPPGMAGMTRDQLVEQMVDAVHAWGRPPAGTDHGCVQDRVVCKCLLCW
jgi:hypothetical protein